MARLYILPDSYLCPRSSKHARKGSVLPRLPWPPSCPWHALHAYGPPRRPACRLTTCKELQHSTGTTLLPMTICMRLAEASIGVSGHSSLMLSSSFSRPAATIAPFAPLLQLEKPFVAPFSAVDSGPTAQESPSHETLFAVMPTRSAYSRPYCLADLRAACPSYKQGLPLQPGPRVCLAQPRREQRRRVDRGSDHNSEGDRVREDSCVDRQG
jgi:hypothetical protein